MTVLSCITDDDVAALPSPVTQYLRNTGVVGKTRVRTVHLRQRGRFRLRQGGRWAMLAADQRYTIDPPAFVWRATISPSPFTPIKVKDAYTDGHGRLEAKLWGMVPVARACGRQTDAGELLRFMGEIAWFPTAWLSPYITWEARDGRSAVATISHSGTRATATLFFDDAGRFVNLSAMRYRLLKDGYSLDKWETPMSGHTMVNGLLIPLKGKAIFKLDTGDFEYFDGEVTSLEYDPGTFTQL